MKIALLTTDNRENFREYEKPLPYFGTAPEALLQGFTRLPEIEVHVLTCTQKPMCAPAKLAANIWFHSLHVRRIGWLRTAYQGCIRAIRKELRRLQPHIVHGQGTERDCALTAALSGFPNVVTIHGNMVELARVTRARFGSYGWLAARLENFTLKRTGGVLCNSMHPESVVKPRAVRTWFVPNPLREPFFAEPATMRVKPECILANVGTITPNKRQIELLQIAQRLHQAGLSFKLLFAGKVDAGDPYGAAFLKKMESAEAEGYAHYEGTRQLPELIEFLDQARAMVHFPKSESFGLVVAEALARNLKLFASRVGGIVDIAAGVEGVEMFEPEDPAGLESALANWLRLGAGTPPLRATAVMRERYHPEAIARRHLAIYQEVLASDS